VQSKSRQINSTLTPRQRGRFEKRLTMMLDAEKCSNLAKRSEIELPVPISEQSDYKKMSAFAAPGGNSPRKMQGRGANGAR
jgi:hypothetical protein